MNYVAMKMDRSGLVQWAFTDSPQRPPGWDPGPWEACFVVEAHDLAINHGHGFEALPPKCNLRHSTPMDPAPAGSSFRVCSCGNIGYRTLKDFKALG